MSSEERHTWVQAVVVFGMSAWYFMAVLGRIGDTPVAEVAYQRLLLWNLSLLIVGVIAASIVVAILAAIGANVRHEVARELDARKRGEAKDTENGDRNTIDPERRDERDIGIHRLGEQIGGGVLGVVVVVTLGLAMMEYEHFWIANSLYAGLVLSALAACGAKIVAYRWGL